MKKKTQSLPKWIVAVKAKFNPRSRAKKTLLFGFDTARDAKSFSRQAEGFGAETLIAKTVK